MNEEIGTSLVAVIIGLLTLYIVVFWVLFPIIVYSKMLEMLKVLRAIKTENERANTWHARADAFMEMEKEKRERDYAA